jgi:hypothetical protein
MLTLGLDTEKLFNSSTLILKAFVTKSNRKDTDKLNSEIIFTNKNMSDHKRQTRS